MPGSLAMPRLWCRTSGVLRAHNGYREHHAQGRHPCGSLVLSRSVLLFAKKKQTSVHRYLRVIATVRLYCHASGIARNGYTGASRLSRTLRTWSYTPAFACIGPLRPAVCVLASLQSQISKHQALANTGLSQRFSCSLSVIYRPYRAKRMPFGQLFQMPTHHPRGAGGLSAVPAWLRRLRVATLRSVVRGYAAPFLSPVAPACRRRDSAAGSLNAARFAPTLAYASGIPPALHWVFFVVLSFVRLLVRNYYS